MADYASKSTAAESQSAAPQARAARTDSPANSLANEPVQAEQLEGVESESELIQTKMDLGAGAERALTGFDSRTPSIAQTVLPNNAANSLQAKRNQELASMVHSSPQTSQLQAMTDMMNSSPRHNTPSAIQRAETPAAPKANNTGLPDNLKAGIESLSGISMDNVRVHYNSSQPAQLQAHAYAQGTDIHVAPGQEKHLPHEAWHVVQQAQGRVRPTMQMKGGVPVNDDAGLEREADVMGEKALGSHADVGSPLTSTPSSGTRQLKALDDLKGGALTGTGTLKASTDATAYNIYEKTLPQVNSKEAALNKAGEANAVIGGYTHTNNNQPGTLVSKNKSGSRYVFDTAHTFAKGEFTKTDRVKLDNTFDASVFPLNPANNKRFHELTSPQPVGTDVFFNSINAPFNKANVLTIDPFLYRIKIKYSDTQEIKLLYQHADQWTGYVVEVDDAATGAPIPMADVLNNTKATAGIPGQYSNRHADTGDDRLSTKLTPDARASEEDNEKSIDAMTKIAGEGARWQSVRKHSSRLTNNSKFFIRTDANNIKYVTFRALWLSWASAFNKAYDISDAKLASEILNNPANFRDTSVQDGTIEDHAQEIDYDVTNGAPYAVGMQTEWTTNYLQVAGSRDKAKIAEWYKRMTRSDVNKSLKEVLLTRSHLERIWIDLDEPLKGKVITALNSGSIHSAVAALF